MSQELARIKFSHAYSKLVGIDNQPIATAVLLQVVSITLDQLSKEFIDYDTDNGKYFLKYDTLFMMLIFKKPSGDLFTTLRPQFNKIQGNKLPYYQGLVGKTFQIIITEETNAHYGLR